MKFSFKRIKIWQNKELENPVNTDKEWTKCKKLPDIEVIYIKQSTCLYMNIKRLCISLLQNLMQLARNMKPNRR